MALPAMQHERWSKSRATTPAGPPGASSLDAAPTSARRWMLVALAGWAAATVLALVAAAEWRRAEQAAHLAGLAAVNGPGVEVVISDARKPPAAATPPAGLPATASQRPTAAPGPGQAVVTDGDLILLNMLLWYGGARAVAINNERITAQTTITSSGPVILINGTRIVGPFHIAALGDPETLKGVLTEAGLIEQMRSAGITVSLSAQPALRVPPWHSGAETAH